MWKGGGGRWRSGAPQAPPDPPSCLLQGPPGWRFRLPPGKKGETMLREVTTGTSGGTAAWGEWGGGRGV